MFTFGELIDLVLKAVRLGDEAKPKIVARVQAMQRQESFPPSERVGTGRRATYSAEQAFQLIYAFKLLEVGITPKRATSLVLSEWTKLKTATRDGLCRLEAFSQTGSFFVVRIGGLNCLRPDGRSPFRTGPESDGFSLSVDDLAHAIKLQPSFFDGQALINVPWVAKETFEAAASISTDKANELVATVSHWQEDK